MKAVIKPSACHGSIHIPPSKSMAHRSIICASLARGQSIISNVDFSDDILATIDCMRHLGAEIICQKDSVIIEGIRDFNQMKGTHIECNESGSTLRFLIPLFSLTDKKITFTGKNRLLKRPLDVYEKLFHEASLLFQQNEQEIVIEGALTCGQYELKGNVSSQFISGLLFALPLVGGDSTLHILPPFESRSYVDLTVSMLEKFGIKIDFLDDTTLFIQGNQHYRPYNYTVEGDFSQFAFFAVLSALNHDLCIQGMDAASLQGDKQILDILSDFCIKYDYKNQNYHIHQSQTVAHPIDLKNCPDLGPILCIFAMFSKGTTRIINAHRLRIKESDRMEAMKCECEKMGCIIETSANEMLIHGGSCHQPSVSLSGWKDHRIVMACAIALSLLGGEILGCEAVKKSYPRFFDDLKAIGIEVVLYDEE